MHEKGKPACTFTAFLLVFFIKMSRNSSTQATAGTSKENGKDMGVYVYDRRKGDKPEEKIQIGGLTNFTSFENKLREVSYVCKGKLKVV